MRYIITIILTLVVQVASSQSLHDGISLRGLETNRHVYYYGEPIQIAFVAKNEDSNTKYYWEPLTGVNFLVEFLDLQKGKARKLSYGSTETPYDYWSVNPPPESAAYRAEKVYVNTYNIGASFGYEQLIKTSSISSPTISDFTKVLPVGKYRVNISYNLLPGKEKLHTSFDFEVKLLPTEEQEALNVYLEAMKYASISHPFYGDKSYSSQHNNSLERFIEAYPDSRYTQHAYSILVNQIYWYYTENITIDRKRQEITRYLTEDKVQLPELKFNMSRMASKFLEKEMVNGRKEEVADKVLKNLNKEDPIISEILINQLGRKHNLKRLKNYACEQQ